MRDQSPQPSQIIFPVALQPAFDEPEHAAAVGRESWGWLEIFVLSQVFWGALLFVPGSQAFRTYIRAFPYVVSLIALSGCLLSKGAELAVPGARWVIAVMVILIANLLHTEAWVTSGIAQIGFQLAIAAPVFWAARVRINEGRLSRLMLLIFGAHFASAALGFLQVHYPNTFLPPEFSSMALRMRASYVEELTYIGTGGRVIVRPPGLSDLPGGAAISGTIAALLAFAMAIRSHQSQLWKGLFFASAALATTVVYLTHVRSMLLMILGGTLVMALVRLRQGRILQSSWIVSAAAALIIGSFAWAATMAGETLQDRFGGLLEAGVVGTYQENRGAFLSYTFQELLYDYPLGAGLGRWGMMVAYFGESGNWQNPPLHAELQLTGWLYDGGIPMLLIYPLAVFFAMRYSYRLAIERGNSLNDLAMMALGVQVLIAGLCFTGPVFNSQIGIIFWLVTAVLYGCERTEAFEAWNAALENAEAEADDAAVDLDPQQV